MVDLRQTTQDIKEAFGFDNVRIERSLGTPDDKFVLYLTAYNATIPLYVDTSVLLPMNRTELVKICRNAMNTLERNAPRQIADNEIDMRYNAIESTDDVRALMAKADRDNRMTDTMVLTPEQRSTVLSEPTLDLIVRNVGLNETEILYGKRIRVAPV